MNAGNTPDTSFEFITEWFSRAEKSATAQGRRDSAQLWRDGLQHLVHLKAERDRLKALNAELLVALKAAYQAINGMKSEAETAAQGDEQMLLEAAESVSNTGLKAEMAIRVVLAKQLESS